MRAAIRTHGKSVSNAESLDSPPCSDFPYPDYPVSTSSQPPAVWGDPAASREIKVEPRKAGFQPLVIKTSDSFPEDLNEVKNGLGEVLEAVDPLEPFERIAKALEALAKQDARFQ